MCLNYYVLANTTSFELRKHFWLQDNLDLCCYLLTVYSFSSFKKIDYFQLVKTSLNPEGYQKPIINSKVIAILMNGEDFAYWWSCIGKGLRRQPALHLDQKLNMNTFPSEEKETKESKLPKNVSQLLNI